MTASSSSAEMSTKFGTPLTARALGSASQFLGDDGLVDGRVEYISFAANHKHVVIVGVEEVTVLGVQQAGASIGRGNGNPHAVATRQARPHGSVGFEVGSG